MTQALGDVGSARESVFEFRTELVRSDTEADEGPTLRFHLERGEASLPAQLSWTAIDGAHSAISFQSSMADFLGVHHCADGTVVQLRGFLKSRRDYPSLPGDVDRASLLQFDTHEGWGGGWHQSGRLRVLLDDGRGCALRDVAWRDQRGNSGSISFVRDRSGFIGYYQRPDEGPIGYRGFALPQRTVPTSDDLMKELEDFGRTALGVAEDLVGRVVGWLGGPNGPGGSGGGPRPA